MVVRVVNTSILALILISLFTGLFVLFFNTALWLMEIHRIASWGLIALVPWKIGISLTSLKRGWDWSKFDRGAGMVISIVLAVMAVTATGTALLWTWRLGPEVLWLYQTMIAWHWIISLILLIPLLIHVVRRWPKPKTEEFTSRRGLLRMGALALAGVAGWGIAETIARERATAESPRRQTGSRGAGEFTGNDFPITGEWISPIDVPAWRLRVNGAVAEPITLTYEDILRMEETRQVATLDCTLGWYTTQEWRGVPLRTLLDMAGVEPGAAGFALRSVTGYGMLYAMAEADDIIINTHIGDEVLAHKHGHPVRAVVPHRRGWFWVKWLGEIRVVRELPDLTETIARIENMGT